jgi:RNA polymerase sigma factor (TIGR02999 family)
VNTQGDVTLLLRAAARGEEGAFDRAVAALYADLERIASGRLRAGFGREASGITLEPSALVHETFLRLLRQQSGFENRRHLLAIASRVMLRVLVDYQRARGAAKRGALLRVTLADISQVASTPATAPVGDVAAALARLEQLDERKAQVVQLRFLWGYENAEVAELLGISVATVERDWKFARSWLAVELEKAR